MVTTDAHELPATPLFAGLDQTDWPHLLGEATRVELDVGQPVFLQGEPADAFFVVLTGSVEVRATNGSGQESGLAHLGAGSVLGETSLFVGGEHSASVYASEPTTLLRFQHAVFMRMVEDGHHAAVRVLSNMAHALAVRLRAADAHIAELARLAPAGRAGQVVRGEASRARKAFLTEWV